MIDSWRNTLIHLNINKIKKVLTMVRRNNVAPGGNEVRMIGSAYRDDRIREEEEEEKGNVEKR